MLEELADTIPLAKTLLKSLTIDVPIVLLDDMYIDDINKEGKPVKYLGVYNGNTKHIELAVAGANPATLLHEIIHGMAIHYLNTADAQSTKDFIKLYKHAQTLPELKGWYGMTDEHEFLAELLSNRNFQEALSKARPSSEVGKYKTLFRELWSVIANWLGISGSDNLFEQSFAVASHVITEASKWNVKPKEVGIRNTIHGKEANLDMPIDQMNDVFEGVNSDPEFTGNSIIDVEQRLSLIYSPAQVVELTDTIVQEFGETINDHLDQNPMLSRREVINKVGLNGLLKATRQNLEFALEDLKEIEGAGYWIANMEQMLENFNDLAIAAIPYISNMEDLKFNMSSYEALEMSSWTESDTGLSEDENMVEEDVTREESTLEGWQINALHTSLNSTISAKVRKVLSTLPELSGKVDEFGNKLSYVNMVGYQKNLVAGYVMRKTLE